jgi:hypothetical protein
VRLHFISVFLIFIISASIKADDFSGHDFSGIEKIVNQFMDPTESWMKNAINRIKDNRMVDYTIIVYDKKTKRPVEGAEVNIRQLRNDFDFGAVISRTFFKEGRHNKKSDDSYKLQRELFLNFGFTKAGFCNSLKYKLFKEKDTSSINEVIAWFRSHNVGVRGHTLIWPGNDHFPKDLAEMCYDLTKSKNKKNSLKKSYTEQEKRNIQEYADKMIVSFSKKWDVDEWDVYNEPNGNHVIQDIVGKQLAPHWFKLARDNVRNKNAKLYINDFAILYSPLNLKKINNNGKKLNRAESYYKLIKELKAQGTEMDGIGFQGRWKTKDADLDLFYKTLDEFSKFGYDMSITEFEVKNDQLSEFEAAERTAYILTLFFSHPKTVGFYSWDPFNGGYPMVNKDGSLRLNGKVWLYLTKNLWLTSSDLKTGNKGVSFKGFKGLYNIEVKYKSRKREGQIKLNENKKLIRIFI